MGSDSAFCKSKIVDTVLGGIILGVVEDGGDGWGLRVMVRGKQVAVWIQADAENNGPGWVEVEDIDGNRSRSRHEAE